MAASRSNVTEENDPTKRGKCPDDDRQLELHAPLWISLRGVCLSLFHLKSALNNAGSKMLELRPSRHVTSDVAEIVVRS
jgi:hypothetical protein